MQSIDALRGFDMFFIIGGGALIAALAKAFPSEVSEFAAAQMAHVKWNGFAFIDMVFPLFLFLAGVSFPFSYAKNRELGMDKRAVFCKIFKRAAILAMLGVVYNGFFKLDFENLRICSVLGRIGIAWAAGACLYVLFDVRKRIFICAAILLGYWGVMSIGGYDFETNFVGAFDRRFMVGRLYQKTFDPEGLLSTLPAVSTALLGIFAGEIVRGEKYSQARRAVFLAAIGIALAALGLCWDFAMPINKKLWTSSYVCFAGGLSFALFGLFYYVIDVLGFRRWAFVFSVIGMNSITVYMAQRIVDFKSVANFFGSGVISLFPKQYSLCVFWLLYIAVVWLFLYFLYRRKIFLKV